jgi:hypothetical protein
MRPNTNAAEAYMPAAMINAASWPTTSTPKIPMAPPSKAETIPAPLENEFPPSR